MAEKAGERILLGSPASLVDREPVELLGVVQLGFCSMGFFILLNLQNLVFIPNANIWFILIL